MQMNTLIWVYLAVHLADESAVGAINRPLREGVFRAAGEQKGAPIRTNLRRMTKQGSI